MENQHRHIDEPPTDIGVSGDHAGSGSPSHQSEQSTPDLVRAAGGVLWRTGTSGEIEVVGVYRPSRDNWSLPKGKLEPGEHRLIGACREVEEETGLAPIPQTFLTRASYRLSRPGGDVTKTVDFWSMRPRQPRAPFLPNNEVSEHRWMPLDEAAHVLTRPRDQQALQAFRRLPMVTGTVILLRHAEAAPGTAGTPDADRDLTPTGRTDASELIGLLAGYLPQQVIAAPPRRCASTVAPLAAALRTTVDSEPAFEADAHHRAPERAADRIRELADSGNSVVICSQAPVIADSLAVLADTDDVSLASVHTPAGGAWVLSFTHKTLVAIERL